VNTTTDIAHTQSLSPHAALVIGLAATSIPFADGPEAEVDRWLRILRMHGRTGRVLQALGVGETSLRPGGHEPARRRRWRRSGDNVVDLVSDAAASASQAREASAIETEDVLAALIRVYGRLFEEALEAHGTSSREVLERLELAAPGGAG
jgi:hypothetical protein